MARGWEGRRLRLGCMIRSTTRPIRQRQTARLACSLASWLSVVAFLCASVGFRVSPERLAGCALRAATERFPCEGCACGCATAEHCWTQCCCHSLEERLAWAESNGVAVPRALIPAAFARLQARAREATLPACCRARDAQDSCCAQSARPLKLPVVSALACKGASGWLVPHHAPPASPLPTAIRLASHGPVGFIDLPACRLASASLAPAPPPPKA